MATMNTVIAHVNEVKPDAYSDDVKQRWLQTVEGMIYREVLQDDERELPKIPEDADKPLVVESPYDDLYELYVCAMIDFHNREYDEYNNTLAVFQERLEQFKALYIRKYGCGKAKNFRNVMG